MSQPTVVIIGASTDPEKFGHKAVKAYKKMGYTVYPVNPKGGEIDGVPIWRSIDELPIRKVNRVSVYLPPNVTEKILDELTKLQFDELWLNPGSENEAVLEKARQMGLDPIVACSIVDLGVHPSDV